MLGENRPYRMRIVTVESRYAFVSLQSDQHQNLQSYWQIKQTHACKAFHNTRDGCQVSEVQ